MLATPLSDHEIIGRDALAEAICKRLKSEEERCRQEFAKEGQISSCIIDNVLPEEWALQIHGAFPSVAQMRHRQTIREDKYVAAQMDQYNAQLEEAIYAFQDPRVVEIVGRITGLKDLEPDEFLYAGGISVMGEGNFLNPHLDNSHDNDRQRYRVLNLLYYVSPSWGTENGGNLELWDTGPDGEPREIVSAFNRLVLMITHESSWHSVNRVRVNQERCCVSNYYFSIHPASQHDYFHVTSFSGRPEQRMRGLLLKLDRAGRTLIRKLFKRGMVKSTHIYRK